MRGPLGEGKPPKSSAETEDTDCHGNELEEEYLLETSSQQELPRGATTHLTTDQALEIEKLLQESPGVTGTTLG